MSDDIEEVSLDESMAETLKEIQAEEADDPGESPEDEKIEEETTEEDDNTERERDEKGRFKKKEADEAADAAAVVEEPGEDDGVKPPTEIGESDKETPPIGEQQEPEIDPRLERAPTTWRTEAKLKWTEIDPVIRDEILKREEDIGRGISQYKSNAEYGLAVQETLQPYMAMINAAGSTPQKAIGSLLDTFYKLTTSDPVTKSHLLLQVAQQHGADMSVFKQDIDPAQANMQQQLQPLYQEINGLKQQLSQREQLSQQTESTQAQRDIEAFRNAVDESGKSKYPHFDIVAIAMADQIESNERAGNTLSLEQAYENAVWATPELRQQFLSEQAKADEAKRQQGAKERAAKAKADDKLNLQNKGTYDEKPTKPTGTVTDTLQETLDKIKGRNSE